MTFRCSRYSAFTSHVVSEPFTSRFGVHLMTVKQRRVVPLTPREQREAVRGMLREKKVDDAFATWAQELRARAYVEFYGRPRVAARVLAKVRPNGLRALAKQTVSFARGWVLNA